jgi:hypothetical protein
MAMLEAPDHSSEDIVKKLTSLLMTALREGCERLAAFMIKVAELPALSLQSSTSAC